MSQSLPVTNQLVNAVKQVAAARPEHQYEGEPEHCLYIDDTGQRCLVGEAFNALGYDDEFLWVLNDHGPVTNVLYEVFDEETYKDMHAMNPTERHTPEGYFLMKVQECQDMGMAWGDAVAETERWMEEYGFSTENE